MKDNLPYFSHYNNAHRHPKMKALIAEYGYEGYGRFWALNERIAETPGACIDISRKVNRLDLAQELGMSGPKLDNFLKFLSDPEIDLINLEDGKITTDRITENYQYTMEMLEKERNRKKNKKIPAEDDEIPPEDEDIPEENGEVTAENDINETKLNETNKTKRTKTHDPQKRISLLDREPKNDKERVEKKWLENYIVIFGSSPIKPRWDITAPLISNALKEVGIEKVLQALETARQDDFCLEAGYILKTIMSGNVLSRLINTKPIGGYMSKTERAQKADKDHFAQIFAAIEKEKKEHG
jgi:hypothetical protein